MNILRYSSFLCLTISVLLADSTKDTPKASLLQPLAGSAKETIVRLTKNESEATKIYPYENTDIKNVQNLNRDIALTISTIPFNINKTVSLTSTAAMLHAKSFEINSKIAEDTHVISTSDQTTY